MPFNVWCTKCGEMIGKGVRFNAEKRHVGMYMSTKIWSFSMRHHCGSRVEIHTDPKNTEYIIVEGARRKVRGMQIQTLLSGRIQISKYLTVPVDTKQSIVHKIEASLL